jgi:tRNA A-37 threonylcarbamoyl transferase component Bud32
MKNNIDKIQFDKILSNDTVYGIIWTGTFEGKSCVIKMIILSTSNFKKQSSNEEVPWLHSQFKDKKPMTKDAFMHEAKSYKTLSDLGIAPKLYDYWLDDSRDVHYGFIVSERLDCSIKQILLERALKPNENKMVEELIDKLHNKYGIVHGDMKPSNIGVYLDGNKEIKKCYFFDCQKVKYKKDLSRDEFNRRVQRDLVVYRDHTIDNREKAKKITKDQGKEQKKELKVHRHHHKH